VFQDLHKLNPGSGSREPAKGSIKILEDHLGKTRGRIEDDFMETAYQTDIEPKARR
jgi:hypothetical protein